MSFFIRYLLEIRKGIMTKEEYEEWYNTVDFINEEMKFYSFKDFIDNAYLIKRLYDNLPKLGIQLYKWYVFANHISYSQKCMIWDFLNGFIGLPELTRENRLHSYFKE